MEIQTKNLILRNYKITDLQAFCNLIKQEKVAYRAGFDPIDDSSQALRKLKYLMQEPFHFAIELKENSEVVGEIALDDLSLFTINAYDITKKDRAKEVEYSISEKYWNKGILSEALPAIVKFGMEKLDLDYILGACFLPNSASKKVMIKAGLIPFKTKKDYVWKETGEKCKIVLSKLSKEQYNHINWYKDLEISIHEDEKGDILKMKDKDINKIRIDSFIYRRGICNALKDAGIETLGQLVEYREDYIKNILFSNRDFDHLKEKIKDFNQQMRGPRIEETETRITKNMFSDRVYKALTYYGGIHTIEDVMLLGSKGLSCIHNIGKEELSEIVDRLVNMGLLVKATSVKELKDESDVKQ